MLMLLSSGRRGTIGVSSPCQGLGNGSMHALHCHLSLSKGTPFIPQHKLCHFLGAQEGLDPFMLGSLLKLDTLAPVYSNSPCSSKGAKNKLLREEFKPTSFSLG